MAKQRFIEEESIHSEDLQEIIAKPPSWLLRRGISFILLTIVLILGLSVFIRYPEIVTTSLKFNTANAPKVLVSKVSGNLTKLLVKDGALVGKSTDIAYLESIADHEQVIHILDQLKLIRNGDSIAVSLDQLVEPKELELGELQSSYQNFYLAYLNYKAVAKEGIFKRRKSYVQQEMSNVNAQNEQLKESYRLQKEELALAEEEYQRYKQLADKRIISPLELQQREAILLSKRQAIPQMENILINNRGNLLSKNKELIELDNQMFEEEKMFAQALNSFISEAENWKKQYVITSLTSGKLIYTSFYQENQLVKSGEELFYIYTSQEDYYGELNIPQAMSSKVKEKQKVLLRVNGYPHQEYGYVRGEIDYLSDIPIRDSLFFAKVALHRTPQDSSIKLKPGLMAEADIITEDQSVFRRMWNNLTKSLKI
ncbi:HlyD family secretion protein [Sphingobacterium sp. SYP-B4668]|uniref:HlyD family secretion protein n=1 Tax=Sphingobacterium sp. SYP-B4668 TaxID=2996035 RepID=UPI0022DE0F17|nr:HlyD family efflux transporter periplasmic adaptor subunit [Sphingobacterium sp. SYP-B4668]